ncbi:MAG TPA: CocE/NonD family hydrolase, partial [Steroidobacteraceae bacterium]|nr:CocE/NonD family hydrolase [Steroidobacteraceae bacterium]
MRRWGAAIIEMAAIGTARALVHDEALLSKPRYGVIFESNVRVPMRDGVTLASDVYRPDAPGRFPAILVRTPYGRAGASISEQA